MDILNLSSLVAVDVKTDEAGDYGIYAVTKESPAFCPACGVKPANLQKFGSKKQRFMDTPIHGQRAGIIVIRQRYRCKDCGGTFWEQLPDMDDDRSMTNRLVEFIRREALARTFVSVAEDVGILEKTVRDVFEEYATQLEAQFVPVTPRWLGMDEVHLLGKPRAVLTNIEECTVVDILEARTKDTLLSYLMRLPDRERVEVVTMDMWKPYKDFVHGVLPNAVVVVDKFHVVKEANRCLDLLRKKIREGMTKKQRRRLMRDRHVLLTRRFRLNMAQTIALEGWTKNLPDLGVAYEVKERFYDIWEAATKREGVRRYQDWLAFVKEAPMAVQQVYVPLLTALQNWHAEIFAYWDHRLTNAYTESFNSLIRHKDRMGRGHSFRVIRVKMLFSAGVRKQKQRRYQKDFFRNILTSGIGDSRDFGADISTLAQWLEKGQL